MAEEAAERSCGQGLQLDHRAVSGTGKTIDWRDKEHAKKIARHEKPHKAAQSEGFEAKTGEIKGPQATKVNAARKQSRPQSP